MIPFVPITNHVNEDRKYFLDGPHFVKMDSNFGRGRHEADVLTLLGDAWYSPNLISTWEADGYFCLRMEHRPGETLENIKSRLSLHEKKVVIANLFQITQDLMFRNFCHNDINESNVLFDPKTQKVSLIDWEMATIDEGLHDIYGERWGLLDLLQRLK